MSCVITFKERGFYPKQAHNKWGECVCVCVCVYVYTCMALSKIIVMEQTFQCWSRLDQ